MVNRRSLRGRIFLINFCSSVAKICVQPAPWFGGRGPSTSGPRNVHPNWAAVVARELSRPARSDSQFSLSSSSKDGKDFGGAPARERYSGFGQRGAVRSTRPKQLVPNYQRYSLLNVFFLNIIWLFRDIYFKNLAILYI